jgi:RNA polymerase sigma-70 factor (ECF subfamily)
MSTNTLERVLVAESKAGDLAAFTELIRRSTPSALRSIRAIARNAADAEDLIRDTLVNALKELGSFDQRSTFTTWLTSNAVNNALPLLNFR